MSSQGLDPHCTRNAQCEVQIMGRGDQSLIKGAAGGAVFALAVSLATLLLPPEFGGYNAWTDVHLALHNLSAIFVRLVVFALIGAALGGAWQRR